MLRKIDVFIPAGLRRGAWDGAAVRRIAGFAALAGATFLLCRARPAPGLAPFAMAFLAAALMAGRSAAALMAGCLLGALNGPGRPFETALPAGAAIVLGGVIAGDTLLPELARRVREWRLQLAERLSRFDWLPDGIRRAPSRQARSPNRETAACALLAGLGALVPGLVRAGGAYWPSEQFNGALQAVAASLAAVAAAPFFRAALEVRPGRRHLSDDERLGLSLLACALAAGAAGVFMPAALCLGGAAVLAAYPCGALAGACLGAALMLMGGDARLAFALACGGGTAQLCAGLSRRAREGACFAAVTGAALLTKLPIIYLAAAGAGPLLAMALPERWLRVPAEWARPGRDFDPDRLAAAAARPAERRLRALAAAFGDLAEGYAPADDLPDERTMVARMREALCAGCPGFGGCWAGAGNHGARLLCDLISEAVIWAGEDGERALFGDEMPPEALRRCRRGKWIPERLGGILADFARDRRAQIKRGAENRLISAQFAQARRILEEIELRPAASRRLSARAAAALERAEIPTEEVTVLDGGAEIVAALAEGRWTPRLAGAAASRLSRALGRRYAPAEMIGRDLRLAVRPRLRVETGAASAPGRAGAPNGDSCEIRALGGGKLMALICDGMGSGVAAARESALAARLLGRFLAAGAARDLAVETVNALLLNRGGDDMFATADLLVVDMNTGEAALTKQAAGPTLLLRGGEARWIGGGRLPLGIVEGVTPDETRLRLAPGDAILMASDGVTDAADPAALEAILRDGLSAKETARRALDAARAARVGERTDDMTAVCLRFGARLN